MMNIDIFLWGFAGSFAVEIVTIYRLFLQRRVIVPTKYRSVLFWVIRVLLAIVAGILAVAYDVQQPLQALCIGAAAPLIIEGLAQGRSPASLPGTKRLGEIERSDKSGVK